MDPETKALLAAILNTQARLIARSAFLSARLSSVQTALERVSQRSGIDSVHGESIPEWIKIRTREEIERILPTMADEQVAAFLQEESRNYSSQ